MIIFATIKYFESLSLSVIVVFHLHANMMLCAFCYIIEYEAVSSTQ